MREAQVKVIAEQAQSSAPIEGFPPILVGDFNASPDADEIRFMRGLCSLGTRSVYFADTFGIVGHGAKAPRSPPQSVCCRPTRTESSHRLHLRARSRRARTR